MTNSQEILEALNDLAIKENVEILSRFFKTGKGEYGEGDVFLGVKVPESRTVVNAFWGKTTLEDVQELLESKYHEMRLVGLLILVKKFEKSKDLNIKKEIVDFYLKNTRYINNWDLVDQSCYKILGNYCFENKQDKILRTLSNSDQLWEKRIAVVGTLYFVKQNSFELTQELVLNNLNHPHDLMHKANGWMLREMGKKDETTLLNFLNREYHKMPRTCLRYAIEKLEETLRQDYLKGRV
ncbi:MULTISPECIES: DNA alkylation repair protein [Amniculibacterium]|jgi:3-methyladenine DNA glycosylase AlkD|uniref:DNA alkylation repair protein n=1 Tax=Amniculibacterium TaxID=2715289 RepID=UPI000F59DB5B|nr:MULTISPECIES: DNA alkylation repair protein [Amniculibacterium]